MFIAQPAGIDMSGADGSTRVANRQPGLVSIVLLPCDSDNGPGPLVAGRLPLSIGRETGLFAEFCKRYPNQVRFLSRQHAYLYCEDGQVYLQDLGSANGTGLNGRRIEARQPLALSDGDRLEFGCRFFSFTLKLERIASEQTGSSTMISNSDNDNAIKQTATKIPAAAGRRRRQSWCAAALAVGMLAGLGFAFYWQNATQWQVEKLLDQQQYRQSLILLKDYLAQHPEHGEMNALATHALIKTAVPQWSYKIDAMLFEQAAEVLADAAALSPDTAEARQILSLLNWISELERFADQRGGMTMPLQLFRHEEQITSLLARWDENAHQREILMIRIIHYVPEFEAIRARISSNLRILRNDQAVYLKAIAELKPALSRLILAGRGSAALSMLDVFTRRYPNVTGVEPLRADLTRLSVMQQAVRNKRLSTVLRLYKTGYKTVLISDLAAQWYAIHLPEPKNLARYQAALAAWDKGQIAIAVTLLKPLTKLVWGAMATAKLEHFQNVAQSFEQLQASRSSAGYAERRLTFQHSLNEHDDRFFIDALSTDMEQYDRSAMGN